MEAESTRTIMMALREVIESKGVFCSLYSDRAGHFFVTPKRGERVDLTRPTQVGRALQELKIRMIPAYPVHEHLDGRVSIRYGPQLLAEYAGDGLPLASPRRKHTTRLSRRAAA